MLKQSQPKNKKELTNELSKKIEEICQEYNDKYHLDNNLVILNLVSIKNENDEIYNISFSNYGNDEIACQCLVSLMNKSADVALLFNTATTNYNIEQIKIRKELEINF